MATKAGHRGSASWDSGAASARVGIFRKPLHVKRNVVVWAEISCELPDDEFIAEGVYRRPWSMRGEFKRIPEASIKEASSITIVESEPPNLRNPPDCQQGDEPHDRSSEKCRFARADDRDHDSGFDLAHWVESLRGNLKYTHDPATQIIGSRPLQYRASRR